MTSSPPPWDHEIIEHIVLFNVLEEENPTEYPTKVDEMMNSLNSLNSLDSVIYLTAGPIFRTRSKSSDLKYTHMLHARYKNVSDLYSYSVHPEHVEAVERNKPICEDVMAVDWSGDIGVVGGDDSVVTVPKPGSAIRVTLLRVEDEDEKEELFEGIRAIQENIGSYAQISYGKNFSDRGQGFNVATLVVFSDLNELDASEDYEDQMRSLVSKFKGPDNDGIIAVDYIVPRVAVPNKTGELNLNIIFLHTR